ncbi:MAG: transglycosylase SLT domain-containing protein [Acidobacteriota bacterium]
MTSVRIIFAGLALLALSAASADAQIYAWTDASGRMVLSDRPRTDGGTVRTFAVAEAPGVTVIRPADERSARFDSIIDHHAAAQGVSADLVRAVIQVESAFNPRALSPKGAMGLMQLMPATASELGVDNPFDPAQNIGGGIRYLKRLLSRYDDKVELALAAYNAGPGAVDKYGQKVPPYQETRDYVKRITKNSGGAQAKPATRIYKWVEVVDGRTLTRYSDRPQFPDKAQ